VDTDAEKKEEARQKSTAVLRRLGHTVDGEDDNQGQRGGRRKEELQLTQYERSIAMDLVAPEDIPIGFDGKVYSPFGFELRLTRPRCQISVDWRTSSKSSKNRSSTL
jgi:hypothetical protein